jgi:hypothetical protein
MPRLVKFLKRHPDTTINFSTRTTQFDFEDDAGLGKAFELAEHLHLKFGVEVFNVSNSVRFDAHSISANIVSTSSFGEATSELTNPRLAQFYGRIEF